MKDVQNKMIRRAIIALVVLAVVIGDLIYYKLKDPKTEATDSSTLIRVDRLDLERVDLYDYSDQDVIKHVVFVGDEGGIILESTELHTSDNASNPNMDLKRYPTNTPNDNVVRLFEYTITNLQSLKTIQENVTDYNQYGLDNPTCTVTMTLKDGDEIGFSVGNTTLTSDAAYYAKLKDFDTVYTISRWDVKNILLKSDNILDLTNNENDE